MYSLKEAWGLISGWIGGNNDSKAAPIQKVAWATNAGGALSHIYETDKELHELVVGTAAACLNARASERSVLRYVVTCYGKTDDPLAIALQNLLDNPNPVLSRIEFNEQASHCYDADGNVAIMLINDDKGIPCEQWLLPSSFFAPRFESTDNPIPIGYQWQDGRAFVRAADLVLLRRSSIKSMPYKGSGVLLDDEANLRLYDAIFRSQTDYFQSGGTPNIALTFPLGVGVSPQQAADYREFWRTRKSTLMFAPDGGKLENYGVQEMNFSKSRDDVEAGIREAFGTPRILLGDTDNVNHNNGQTAIAIFERTTVLRFGQKIAGAYEMRFRQNFHPFINVSVDPAVIQGFTTLAPDNGLRMAETVDVSSGGVGT